MVQTCQGSMGSGTCGPSIPTMDDHDLNASFITHEFMLTIFTFDILPPTLCNLHLFSRPANLTAQPCPREALLHWYTLPLSTIPPRFTLHLLLLASNPGLLCGELKPEKR